jgi:hypothetical protein
LGRRKLTRALAVALQPLATRKSCDLPSQLEPPGMRPPKKEKKKKAKVPRRTGTRPWRRVV